MKAKKMSSGILIKKISTLLEANDWRLTTAESCTGGLLAATFISIPGASSYFDRGFITYNDTAKNQMLGVSNYLIKKHGAVSEAVARAMAKGALTNSKAQIAISTTGCAGPARDEHNTPVGIVWVGIASKNHHFTYQFNFSGNRRSINQQTVYNAFYSLLKALKK